jgi:hypothetical protein
MLNNFHFLKNSRKSEWLSLTKCMGRMAWVRIAEDTNTLQTCKKLSLPEAAKVC